MIMAIYLFTGLLWTYIIDRYSYKQLEMPPMSGGEIFIQVFIWPVGMIIFGITFFKEVFSKKD